MCMNLTPLLKPSLVMKFTLANFWLEKHKSTVTEQKKTIVKAS